MKPVSDKRRAASKIYLAIREEFMCEVRWCEARVHENCTQRNDQVHHLCPKSARPELYTDPRNFVGICLFCHDWIDRNVDQAERAGFHVRGHDWEWLVERHLDDTPVGPDSWDNRLVVALREHGRPDLDD